MDGIMSIRIKGSPQVFKTSLKLILIAGGFSDALKTRFYINRANIREGKRGPLNHWPKKSNFE
jgi:hypothetical protein